MLRDLAGFRGDEGCAVSLYLDLDPSVAPTPANLDTRVNSLIHEAGLEAEQLGWSREGKKALEFDLARIRDWWDGEFERDGARGVALFASSLDDLWRPLRLSEPVQDDVRIGTELYLVPLVPLVGRDDGALVVVMSRERGEVYRLRNGRLEEVVDETEEQPGQHDQGGWSQARYQRHIEKLVHDHLKTVGSEIDRRLRGARLELVVAAPQELRSEIETVLSNEAREAIVGWTHAEANATPAELLEAARPLLARAHAKRAADALERWRMGLGRNERATADWEDTLEAASDGRVELLFVQPGANHPAYRCPKDGRASIRPGACPLDGIALEPHEDGLDLAVHHVLAYGGEVIQVEAGRLDEQRGIGARLRF
jgi:peptide chain release factor subunit 1